MWQVKEDSLYKKFEFDDFDQAASFIKQVFDIAREMNHHPKVVNEYNTVEIWLVTHSAGNKVTKTDEDFASRVDNLFTSKAPESPSKDSVKLFTDGGSRGNPGPSAIGYVIRSLDDSVVKKYGKYIGLGTNNRAEYEALLAGLQDCLSMGVKRVQVFMDSELIVNQMTGKYKVKNQDLRPLYLAVQDLEKRFEEVSFIHVLREHNGAADSLVNQALDQAASG